MMKWKKLFSLLMIFWGSLTIASQIPVYFQSSSAPAAPFNPPDKSELALANEAFSAKYGAETGFVGTSEGTQGQLVILVSDMQFASGIWSKMVGAGDAFTSNGVSYFIYNSEAPVTALSSYQIAGRIQMTEFSSAALRIMSGIPEVKQFLVVMDQHCIFASAKVATWGDVPIQATKLIASHKMSASTIGYEHTVNGGNGALLHSISVTLGGTHHGLLKDTCFIDIYVRH
jgi:hypothetical protein